MRDNFESKIRSVISGVTVNGETAERLPNTSNIRILGTLADAVITNAENIEISSGSACTSNTIGPSHVLTAMGLDRTAADVSIRISLGRHTESNDIGDAIVNIAHAVEFVRERDVITESLR